MKNMIRFCICLLALVCLFSGCKKETVSTQVGEPVLGSFSTVDINADPVDQQTLSGSKLTMVNIWGTFCSPCIGEMPDLAALDKEFGEDFQVIGIIIDVTDRNGNVLLDKKSEALSIIETTGADYLHLVPSDSLNKAYLKSVTAVPETIFVDASGNQIGDNYLGAKSHAQWKQIIQSLLESLS